MGKEPVSQDAIPADTDTSDEITASVSENEVISDPSYVSVPLPNMSSFEGGITMSQNGDTLCNIRYLLAWTTRSRDQVLNDDIALRTRSLIREICAIHEAKISRGVVASDYVQIEVVCPPTLTLISEVIHVVTFDPQNSETYRLGWAFPQRNGYMAWFSMSISSPVPRAYAALLFGVCTVLMGRLAYESTRFHQKMGLWFAGLLCLFYAVDKITALHSVLPVSYRQMLLSNWMLWCIPIIPIMYGFFRVPYQIRYWFILGCLLLASSFAIDRWSVYITGRYSGHHMIGALMGDAEGLMEMLGAVLVIHGMLVYRAGGQVGRKAGGQKGKANSRKGIDAKTLFRA